MDAAARIRAAARREDGFTIVEVLAAVLVLSVGIVSLVGSFDPARHLGTNAEIHQVASARAEAELNRVTSLSFKNIALKENPSIGAIKTEPNYFVSNGPCAGNGPPAATKPCYQWDWTSSSSIEALDVEAATEDATANPQSWTTTVSSSGGTTRLSGKTYRFITWANDSLCKAATCGGANDYKRVTVAVTVTGMKTPVELSTLVTNPVGEYDPTAQGGVTCSDQGVNVPCVG
jgi:Tfp pilus assembly protein PilV